MDDTKTTRTCGGCTACCKILPVDSLNKEAWEWCTHCVIGRGCAIYRDRPPECRAFECQWLKDPLFYQEDERPDHSKIIVDYCELKVLGTRAILVFEVTEGALTSRSFAMRVTAAALEGRIPVLHVPIRERGTLFVPETITISAEARSQLAQARVRIAIVQYRPRSAS